MMTPWDLITQFPELILILGAGLVILISKNFVIAIRKIMLDDYEPIDKKKSYEDEMSIYDDSDVEQPQRLPQQTGLSLEELFTEDGEITDEAYMRMK